MVSLLNKELYTFGEKNNHQIIHANLYNSSQQCFIFCIILYKSRKKMDIKYQRKLSFKYVLLCLKRQTVPSGSLVNPYYRGAMKKLCFHLMLSRMF
jgi:hypothetical protein